jgi:hypothetical protein
MKSPVVLARSDELKSHTNAKSPLGEQVMKARQSKKPTRRTSDEGTANWKAHSENKWWRHGKLNSPPRERVMKARKEMNYGKRIPPGKKWSILKKNSTDWLATIWSQWMGDGSQKLTTRIRRQVFGNRKRKDDKYSWLAETSPVWNTGMTECYRSKTIDKSSSLILAWRGTS